MNMSEQSKEAAEIKKIPTELLEYLPRRRWQMTVAALIALAVVLSVFLVLTIKQNIRNARLGAELNRYESLWENKGISNYEYAIEARNDNGRSKVAVRVEDGAAISEGLANPFTSEIYGVPTDIDSFDTVPDLFSIISKALREKQENWIMELAIQYSGDLGYPTQITLTPRNFLGRSGMYSYNISNFRVLHRYPQLEAELDKYANLWQSKGLSSYAYTIKAWTGEEYSEVSVRVEDGMANSKELASGGSLDINSLDTVPDLFNRIRKALLDKEESGFNTFDIQYNADLGYPTYIALRDPYKPVDTSKPGDPGTYTYAIVDFKILQEGQTAK